VGPFAVLGLVLMACTARVCRVVGITAHYEEIASEDMKGILTAVDDGAVVDEFGNMPYEEEEWDEGVVLMREE
jgi:ribonuclease MRP protein subunit RMP1